MNRMSKSSVRSAVNKSRKPVMGGREAVSASVVRNFGFENIEYTIMLRFTDVESAEGWREKPEYLERLARITTLTEGSSRILQSSDHEV